MYKLEWYVGNSGERVFVVVPDHQTLFALWWALMGYGRQDGCKPRGVVVTDLDGNAVDMSQGLAYVASCGTTRKEY